MPEGIFEPYTLPKLQPLKKKKKDAATTSHSRDSSSYLFLLHLHYAGTCYQVQGGRVVGYGQDLQRLDSRNNAVFARASCYSCVGCSKELQMQAVLSFEVPSTVFEADIYRWEKKLLDNNLKVYLVVKHFISFLFSLFFWRF